MPTRVLLEGPAIEPLLEQVREEYGSQVKIISADKVRSGGIGGFFAKQKYELSVEVPDGAGPAPEEEPADGLTPAEEPRPSSAGSATNGNGNGRNGGGIGDGGIGGGGIGGGGIGGGGIGAGIGGGSRPDEPITLEQLLARVESQDHFADANTAAPVTPVTRPTSAPVSPAARPAAAPVSPAARAAAVPISPAARPAAAPTSPAAAPTAGLTAGSAADAAAESAVEPAAEPTPPASAVAPGGSRSAGLPPRAGMLSTNGAAFAEIMAGLGAGPVATTDGDAEEPRPAVRPFRPLPATGTPVNAFATPIRATKRNPYLDDALISDLTSTAAALLGAATEQSPATDDATGDAPGDATADATDGTAAAPPAAAKPRAFARPAPQPTPEPAAAQPAAVQPAARPAAAAAATADVHTAKLIRDLAGLGMPGHLAELVDGPDAYSGVLRALAATEPAPAAPDRPGDVLVIAGELAHVMPVARQVVQQLGLEETQLLLAGPSCAGTGIHASRRIESPEDAERRARRMHRADAAHVVVVDAPVSGADGAWIRAVCDALDATAVWAVVDATRKTSDTRRHLDALGDVEAIVVHGVANTTDPASVLGLDLPIVSLDGRPATRRAWATLICERLTADLDSSAPARRRRRTREH